MTQALVTVVIPARNEPYLKNTILDLLYNASGLIEIIAVLDGYWPQSDKLILDNRVHYIHFGKPHGMRACINAGVAMARGEYILKTDAHCSFSHSYDEILKKNCEYDWVVVPRRYSLDVENWKRKHKPPIDYMYLAHPDDPSVWGGKSLQGKEWIEKNRDKLLQKIFIDDLMTAQGSCWFMKKSYYYWLDLMDEENYGEFAKEMQEIGLKCWLSGGKMKRNKLVWYAHWHKPKSYGRGYSLSKEQWKKGTEYTAKWMNTSEKLWRKQKYDINWLINKFGPVPGWNI